MKLSRIIKRRTVANEVCDAKKVYVNGSPARASYSLKIGDIIELSIGSKKLKVQVENLNETVRKEEAHDMYKVLE